ncbi:MotE family protein [Thioclava atlantica]|uniref:Magnesium transporter MgtE intracellular domain-containing protein n=1 Tax=Thioclava atlantica TaxID=1317124 RepID=A0A085TVL0_9RHOB|nr:hypothetical protein [Thioclava atlantica]KFE34757.1 hypothetical protein DW2_11146 [Thioclava atlantica]
MSRGGAPHRKRRFRLGRGALWIIAGLFLLSGGLRAVEIGASARATEAKPAAPGPASECVAEPGVMALLEDLRKREARLIEQEDLLNDRRSAQVLAEKRLGARLKDLVAAEQELARTVAIADRAAEEDVARLVALYENMKPKQAAPLFAEMAPEFAAGFLGRMRPDAAAAVMESLDPKIAYTISVLMAGRNAAAPSD